MNLKETDDRLRKIASEAKLLQDSRDEYVTSIGRIIRKHNLIEYRWDLYSANATTTGDIDLNYVRESGYETYHTHIIIPKLWSYNLSTIEAWVAMEAARIKKEEEAAAKTAQEASEMQTLKDLMKKYPDLVLQ
jgi:hypothetical protein